LPTWLLVAPLTMATAYDECATTNHDAINETLSRLPNGKRHREASFAGERPCKQACTTYQFPEDSFCTRHSPVAVNCSPETIPLGRYLSLEREPAAARLADHYPGITHGRCTPVSAGQTTRCFGALDSGTSYNSTCIAHFDELYAPSQWCDTVTNKSTNFYCPGQRVPDRSFSEQPAYQPATSRRSRWHETGGGVSDQSPHAAAVAQAVELWQRLLCLHAAEITSLTLHIWRRIESRALSQSVFPMEALAAGCFWVALKLFLYRPMLPRASKLRRVLQLPAVNFQKAELAIMNWVDWSPLRND